MATQLYTGRASALPSLTLVSAAIPRLSRHDLEALAERLIDRLDALDEDREPEEDCCSAHEDRGSAFLSGDYMAHGVAYNEDDEPRLVPVTLNPDAMQ